LKLDFIAGGERIITTTLIVAICLYIAKKGN